MGDQPKSQDTSELLRRALTEIDQLQAKLFEAEAARHEPIAILGIGCRLPGANASEELWRNLVDGVDCVTEVPPYRWDAEETFDPDPDAPGKSYSKWGGFVGDVAGFDAAFFGITPREAVSLDPQQRLLLEGVWRALEDANVPPDSLAGTNAGIFLGISSFDYAQAINRTLGAKADAYVASGIAHSIAGGRISYFLGAQGPNITLDTACSSSMVATYLAVKSLRDRETNLAISGGVNLMLAPEATIFTSKARMLSPTGRCNTFDELADGYVRGEGCGMLVLKRLSDAQRDGDRILALIRGIAVNQDGRSSGLTAPRGPSQEAVLLAALADAGLTPEDVAFVEAHGTGTALGDRIEVNALAKVFAGRDKARPLLIGSIKANIGHAEPAAGVAGLIKAVEALRRRTMPKQLHLSNLNPLIKWHKFPILVPRENMPLEPEPGKPLVCGVSSFGFSGTNSHAVLQEAPPMAAQAPERHAADVSTLLALSARTSNALSEVARDYADFLERDGSPDLRDVAAAAPLARSQFAERAAIVAADAAEAVAALREFAGSGASANAVTGRALSAAAPEVVFLFTGQGAQYVGMGQHLYETEEAFREALDRCDVLAEAHLGRSLKDVMFGGSGTDGLLDDTTYTQPALFAIEYALAAVWRRWGVQPAAVMGHSVGEYTAACIAGVLSLDDAVRLICARGALMGRLPREGGMAAVFAPEDVVRAAISPARNKLSVAGVNGPANIAISGASDALEDALARLAAEGVEFQRLNVSHAFHSPLMDPILDEFERVASEIHFSEPQITLMSNISGAPIGAEARRPDYWRRHLREAVRFSDSIVSLQRDGFRVFLEIGPAPILTGMAQRCVPAGEPCTFGSSLRKGRDDRRCMLEAAGRLFTAGASLDWPAIVGPRNRFVSLPRYPFQRTRYWVEGDGAGSGSELSGVRTGHPLLGNRAATAAEMYLTRLSLNSHPWMRSCLTHDFTLFPAAGFVELALAAARESAGADAGIENLRLAETLLLPENGEIEVQVVVSAKSDGAKSIEIYSAVPAGVGELPKWRLHCSAAIASNSPTSRLSQLSGDAEEVSVDDYYQQLAAKGAVYGLPSRCLHGLTRIGSEVAADIALPESISAQGYILHPALLDVAIQTVSAGIPQAASATGVFTLGAVRSCHAMRPQAAAVACRVSVAATRPRAKTFLADLDLLDAGGEVIASLRGVEVRKTTRGALRKALLGASAADWCFVVKWRAAELGGEAADLSGQDWLLFADGTGVASAVADELRRCGANPVIVNWPDVLEQSRITSAVSKAAPIHRPLHGAILLWPLDAPPAFEGYDELPAAVRAQADAALFALRAVVDRAGRVLVVTRGTQQAGNRGADLIQSPVWAFAGGVSLEHPGCGLKRIDLDPSRSDDDAEAILSEAGALDREDRIAYRDGVRYVARLSSCDLPADEAPVELSLSEPAALKNLALAPQTPQAPGAGEIELRVRASGLNFRDVLTALGMNDSSRAWLGMECSGVVTRVGPGVTRLEPGDEVIALCDGAFATFAVAREAMCVRKSTGMTFQDAAAIPVAFLTAQFALNVLAKVKPGDRVLIHGITGGVGMAAAQVALRAGAVVFGTAGTPAKRRLAEQIGATLASDLRSTAFVDDVIRETGGEGVEIVLNSLSGELIPASLGLVKKGGVFVEIGGRDIWDARTVAEKYPGLHYRIFDLEAAVAADPQRARSLLEDVLEDMKPGGRLRPLPKTVFELSQVTQAFRYISQGRHTGKVVITQRPSVKPRSDGVYVITGGLTGLGLTTAEWLSDQGAGGLVLLGRRAPNEAAKAVIESIQAKGVNVLIGQVDVADTGALAALLVRVRAGMGPIRGVFHAAGVLDDGMLGDQTPERIARVMAPKVAGGWLLHELTRDDPLDFFVLFSSASALLGSPGQSNYVAANGFLDGLAAYRQARGLPALTINWGSWTEVGMAAGVGADHHRRWAAMGLELITPELGMDMLSDMMARGTYAQMAAIPMVRSRLAKGAVPLFYEDLASGDVQMAGAGAAVDVMAQLRDAVPEGRRAVLDSFVFDQVRRVLALSASQKLDVHESLLNLGMDSLMAMELRNRLQAMVGVRLAASDFISGASAAELSRLLFTELATDGHAPASDVQTGAGEVEWEEGRL